MQCLIRSNFDYDNDTLIQLGDICDGWSETYECVEILCEIRNLISIRGNHDQWFLEFIETGAHPEGWNHGGLATLKSYGFNCLGQEWEDFQLRFDFETSSAITNFTPNDIPIVHKEFFRQQKNYHIDKENNLFIHGGFNRHFYIEEQPSYFFYWDRDLWNSALSFQAMNDQSRSKNKFKMKNNFKEVFIGHTATVNWSYDNKNIGDLVGVIGDPITTPMKAANIWNLDNGAGFKGKLTFMNLETKQYVQSDFVKTLYPNERGR